MILLKKDYAFIEEWGKIRNEGILKYLLISKYFIISILVIVIISSLAFAIISIYTGINVLTTQVLIKTLIRIIFALIMLIIYSFLKWTINERKYNELTKDKE